MLGVLVCVLMMCSFKVIAFDSDVCAYGIGAPAVGHRTWVASSRSLGLVRLRRP